MPASSQRAAHPLRQRPHERLPWPAVLAQAMLAQAVLAQAVLLQAVLLQAVLLQAGVASWSVAPHRSAFVRFRLRANVASSMQRTSAAEVLTPCVYMSMIAASPWQQLITGPNRTHPVELHSAQ